MYFKIEYELIAVVIEQTPFEVNRAHSKWRRKKNDEANGRRYREDTKKIRNEDEYRDERYALVNGRQRAV